jgi:predicted lysophospholipase L1 biosynthesis ABC-type transport system permease subunit
MKAEQSRRTLAIWLFAVCGLIALMVVVGGLTRLTGSGLSITEWKPITGVIPPLSEAAWLVEFGILGLTAGLTAAIVGTVASFGVAHYILHTDWVFLPGTLILTLVGALATMLVFGYAGTSAALRARPASMLRND